MTTKQCSWCKEIKSVDSFRIDRKNRSGLTSWCIECINRQKREKRAEQRKNRTPVTLSDRFWPKVDVRTPNECWNWLGSIEQGYGRVDIQDKHYGAHRIAWMLTHDGVMPDLCVLHTCDNPSCVNPNHLFLGTRGDNNRDRAVKGRSALTHVAPSGEASSAHKLTAESVRDLRILYAMGVKQTLMADLWNIKQVTVSAIVHRTNWPYTDLDLLDLVPHQRQDKDVAKI